MDEGILIYCLSLSLDNTNDLQGREYFLAGAIRTDSGMEDLGKLLGESPLLYILASFIPDIGIVHEIILLMPFT